MQSILFRKTLVFTVMILFIGTAILPNINSEKDIRLKIVNNKTVGLTTNTLTFYPTDDSTIAQPDPDSPCGTHTEIAIRNEYGSGGASGWGNDCLIKFDWHPATEPFNIDVEKNPTPKCNTKWFFLCNINTSGFVDQAYEFLQGKYIGVMYYGSSQGDFGNTVVNKIMKRFDSNHVYSVFVYGFKGKTSWNRSIRESNIWIEGFAFAV